MKGGKVDQNNQTFVSISSNLFRNNDDNEQFECIFNSIRNSPLAKSMDIADVINQNIAEYSTGKWEFCANKSCMNIISVLKQDLDLDIKSSIDHKNNYFKQIGFKFCVNSQRYFCGMCMDKAVYLTYCEKDETDDCCCWNVLHFIPHCEECECDNIIPEKAIDCDCECCWFARDCCNCCKNICKVCWEDQIPGICEGCGENMCDECVIFPHSHHSDFPHVHSFYRNDTKKFGIESIFQCLMYKMCIKCYERNQELTKKCNKCKIECKLYFQRNPYLFCDRNKRLPLMIRCNAGFCNTYVCYGCGENGTENALYLKCSHCDDQVYPATLCAVHAAKEITCPRCFYRR